MITRTTRLKLESLDGRILPSAVVHGPHDHGGSAGLNSALAAARPYVSSGTAVFTGPGTFVGSGRATHLGNYTETGTLTLVPTSDPAVFEVTADSTYTAANGDTLTAHYTGTINFATGAISATGTYTGGSGRFVDASGTANLSGQVQEDGTLVVSVTGSIDY